MVETTTATTTTEQPTEGGGSRRLVLLVVLAAVLALGIAVVVALSESPGVLDVDVPAGTGGALDSGEVVEVVPPILRIEPGDSIELDNHDTRLHVLGTLRADAGEAARLAFPTEGRYVLPTSLRSDGQVTVLVEDPDAAG